ncbi:bZIP transcription factor 1 [Phytophthora nicotianae]|nr:bZIP transcription factor 1 [Phytophthora nicotianae]
MKSFTRLESGGSSPQQHQPLFQAFGEKKEGSPRRLAASFTRKRDVTELYDARPEPLLPSSPSAYGATVIIKPRRKRLQTQRRREQCRNNQARYRTRQREFIHELQERVEQLREEVQNLSVKRHTLCYGVQTKNNIWHVVVEYFRLFRYGYLAPMSEPNPSNLRDQEWFLRSAMSPDIVIGEQSGVDALIEQWRRYSTYFGNLNFQLKGMEEQPFGALVATASFSFTITETSLRHVFPHLLATSGAEDTGFGTEHTMLWTRLLGRRLDCRCSLRFQWDDSAGRVTQLDWKMDLLTTLLRVLGNLEDVNRVLKKALITSDNLVNDLPTNIE